MLTMDKDCGDRKGFGYESKDSMSNSPTYKKGAKFVFVKGKEKAKVTSYA